VVGSSCFQTTYEELKRSRRQRDSLRGRLPDYLWGIETKQAWQNYMATGVASRLPMRNWNLVPLLLNNIFIPLPDYLWGIETVARVGGNEANFASRLPMRNWNPILVSADEDLLRLPDYLWGIETGLLFPIIRGPLIALPDYLWGIETRSHHTVQSHKQWLPDYLWGIETKKEEKHE